MTFHVADKRIAAQEDSAFHKLLGRIQIRARTGDRNSFHRPNTKMAFLWCGSECAVQGALFWRTVYRKMDIPHVASLPAGTAQVPVPQSWSCERWP